MSDKFQGEYLKVKGEWGADKVEAGGSNSITDNLSTLTVTFNNDKNGTILRGQLQKIAENLNKAVKKDGLDDAGVGRLVNEYDGKIKQAVMEARKEGDKDVESLISILDGIIASGNLKADPKHVVANKNSNPDTNPLLSFFKNNTRTGNTVGNRVPKDIK